MIYSSKFKERVLAKMLAPGAVGVPQLAKDVGVCAGTLYRWRHDRLHGVLVKDDPPDDTPKKRSALTALDKLRLVLDATELDSSGALSSEERDYIRLIRQDQGRSTAERGALEDEVELRFSAWLRRHGYLEEGAEGRPDDEFELGLRERWPGGVTHELGATVFMAVLLPGRPFSDSSSESVAFGGLVALVGLLSLFAYRSLMVAPLLDFRGWVVLGSLAAGLTILGALIGGVNSENGLWLVLSGSAVRDDLPRVET